MSDRNEKLSSIRTHGILTTEGELRFQRVPVRMMRVDAKKESDTSTTEGKSKTMTVIRQTLFSGEDNNNIAWKRISIDDTHRILMISKSYCK